MTIKDISKIEDLIGDTIRKFVATIKDYPEDVVYYERYGSEHGWYSRPYDGIVGGGIDFLFGLWYTIIEINAPDYSELGSP